MRYASTDDTGHVTLHACVPKQLVNSEGQAFRVMGIMRQNGRCLLYGEFGHVDVGDEAFDVSDMADDHIPGWTVIWPDFETDIKAKWYRGSRVVSHRVIKRDEILEDRTFRKAWRDNGKIDVDMPVAREIQRERIRMARAPMLEALDVEYQKADERNETNRKRDIAANKQKLRDFTKDPRIDAAKTPDELKAILPDANDYL